MRRLDYARAFVWFVLVGAHDEIADWLLEEGSLPV